MYGGPFVPLTFLPGPSQSPLCVQTGRGQCDVMPLKHLGNLGGDVMSCLDGYWRFWDDLSGIIRRQQSRT